MPCSITHTTHVCMCTYIYIINFLKCFYICKSVGQFPYPCAYCNVIGCIENKQELISDELN